MSALSLSSKRAKSLSLQCVVPASDDLLEAFRSKWKVPFATEGIPNMFVGSRGRRSRGSDIALVTLLDKPSPHLHISLVYGRDLDVSGVSGLKLPSIDSLIEELERLKAHAKVTVQANFAYGKRGRRSLLRVPLQLFDASSLPFDEIRGYRLVKFSDKMDTHKVAYSVVVDWDEDEGLTHLVSFDTDIPIAAESPAAILEEAADVSIRFLSEGDK